MRVQTLEQNVTLAEHARRLRTDLAKAKSQGRFPNARAVLVEGVHMYGQLLDFDDLVVDEKRNETEASHKRVLEFLNAHYQVWDSIVEEDDALRVDFHGPRLHTVITEPAGNPRDQVRKSIALAAKLTEAAKRVGDAFGFPSRVRFGVDHGTCVALTTGRTHETDTLFLGTPANHAAKVAANGTSEGIFLTDNAKSIVSQVATKTYQGMVIAEGNLIEQARKAYTFGKVDAAASFVIQNIGKKPTFVFHRATPPLSEVKFSELYPSNSIRMGMASLFADIDGYTAFIDNAIRSGTDAVRNAVVGIHVIREELNDVLKVDSGGKRVRFIGDCIHGLISKGVRADDPAGSVEDAAICAAAMRSSFNLCLDAIPGLSELDLAIGIEYGPVPLTRLGKPGDESVRCATGNAVVASEREQQKIEGGGIRLGEAARKVASTQVNKHFGESRRILEYDDAVNLLGSVSSPVATIVKSQPAARSHLSR
jgi:class 3 adenylate cyclase